MNSCPASKDKRAKISARKAFLTAFFVFASISLFLPSPEAAQPNLLLNPSFETNTGIGGSAADWTSQAAASTEVWANHTGTWGMAMRAWINSGTGQAYQEVDITPNITYNYTVWTLRDSGPLVGSFYIKLAWYNGASFISENLQNVTVDPVWVKQALVATAPSNANKVRVILGSSNINFTGKFDDAELTVATVYYVRADGNDANLGTENSPQGAFKTIQKAANIVNPLDIVEVQPGAYNEQVTITRSGLRNQYITFRANGEAIIDGQNIRPYCVKSDGADYVKIEGFTIRNATDNGILLNNGANYNVILNNTCRNNGASGIRLNLYSSLNTIKNNICYSNGYGTSAYGDRPCGIYLFNSSNYNTLDSNVCRNNTSTGIWLEGSSSYCTVNNNKTYSNGWGGLLLAGGTVNNTVSYNLSYSNSNFGLEICYSANNNLIKNNTIYSNQRNGIQLNNTAINNTIKNNIISNNGLSSLAYYGIYIEAGSSATSIYNDIHNNGLGGTHNYGGFIAQGPGDISLDPLFKSADPSSFDYLKLKSLSGGDLVESPCIDSGSPSDTPSVQSGKRIDIGAYDLYSHAPIQGGLLAEYFDDQNFTLLKLIRIDPKINFDWGNSSPVASIGIDTFSVRWQGQVKIDYPQAYTFYLTTDDGSRLWIDNQIIIDKWYDQGPTEHQAAINLSPGFHDIKYEYYENGWGAAAKLYWSAPSINKSMIPSDHLYYFGRYNQDNYIQGGLKGTYSKLASLTSYPSYIFTRIDPQINFDWGWAGPDAALGNDLYSVKWKGKIRIPAADTYVFYATTDEGVRLWVNNQRVIESWTDGAAAERQGSIYLNPGLYDVELNYYENGGAAVCKLLWSSSTIVKQAVSQVFLYYKNDAITEEGGLLAEYFDNKDLTSPKIKKQDTSIDFDWLSSSPDPLIQPDTFSTRWTGQIKADYNETYSFYLNSDDGCRLYIDGQLRINSWSDKGLSESIVSLSLTQGWHDIKVEYYENTGLSSVKLAYSSPSTPKTIISQDHLRSLFSAEDAALNFYSTLNIAQDVQTPYAGRSASIIQSGTGQVNFEWAKFNKGVLLNGSTDGNNDELIQLSSSDLNKKEGEIEFWFRPNWNSDDGMIHYLFVTTWNWDGCIEILKYSNNSLYWKIVKDGVQHCIVSDTSRKWSAGEWRHLAFSYGPQGMKFYIDFNEIPISWTFHSEAPYTGSLPDTFASGIYLGGADWGAGPSDAIFDEIKIYNKQIVPSDRKAPIFTITSHQDNQTVNSSPVTISGTIDDNLAQVTVNGIQAVVSNGTFSVSNIPLSLGQNAVTVSAADQSSNISSKSITLTYVDATPPAAPTVTPVVSPTNVHTQTLSGTKEADSSIWINGTQAVPLGSLTAWSKSVDLSEGTNNLSVTSKDATGNESAAVLVTITLDTVLPSGAIRINNDASYVNSTAVTLNISAADPGSGTDKMQFSNDGVNWLPEPPATYGTTYPWTLETGDGAKTVYGKFKDKAGNWSAQEIKDAIILDTTPPAVGISSPLNNSIVTGGE